MKQERHHNFYWHELGCQDYTLYSCIKWTSDNDPLSFEYRVYGKNPTYMTTNSTIMNYPTTLPTYQKLVNIIWDTLYIDNFCTDVSKQVFMQSNPVYMSGSLLLYLASELEIRNSYFWASESEGNEPKKNPNDY